MTKLTSFQRTKPRCHTCVIHCIMEYYWLSACARPNWFPDV